MKIKICGLRREEDIFIVNETEPDYIGFVFAKGKREISEETAAYLGALLKPQIRKAGVFVDAPKERVIRMLQKGIIDLAQLHGNESEEYVRQVAKASGKPVIKAVILKTGDALRSTAGNAAENASGEPEPGRILTGADYLLLDSGKGSGTCLDWGAIPDRTRIGRPYFLAGGLTPENVVKALDQLADRSPFGVDVSSGVETDGYKDAEKIKAFVDRVRGWQPRYGRA